MELSIGSSLTLIIAVGKEEESMSSELAGFWLRRHKEVGHTGWKNTVIYAYDQIERLSVVSEKLDSLNVECTAVIDFGCGTGDFSFLMLQKGFRVWGYDPYVQPRISHNSFTYTEHHEGLDMLDSTVGLILSVTVLDHILDGQELEDELSFLRSKVSERGVLLMMEYALDGIQSSSNNKYQAFRTINEWERQLYISGWQISNIKAVPHPIDFPSEGFDIYRRSLLVRLTENFARYRFFNPLLRPLLTKCAQSIFDRYGIGKVDKSPLKLILCKPM